jgi:hypothetical protein
MNAAGPADDEQDLGLPSSFIATSALAEERWELIQQSVDEMIWSLAGLRPSLGACLTAQFLAMRERMAAVEALLKERSVDDIDPTLAERVPAFRARLRDAEIAMNRLSHPHWLARSGDDAGPIDPRHLSEGGRDGPMTQAERIAASRNLAILDECHAEFERWRAAIATAVLHFRKMP